MSLMFAAVAVLVLIMVALVQLFKFLINNSSQKILESGQPLTGITKKFYDVDINRYAGLFTNIGLIISLAVVLTAFEWKTYDEIELVDLGSLEDMAEETIEIPPTEQKPPPPPKLVQPEIIEVPNEEVIEDIKVDLNVEVTQETVIQKSEPVVRVVEEPVQKEEVDEIFTIVEETAEPIGGMEAFYKYVGKTMKYPSQARRMGVEGKVYVQFVVDRDGSITDVKVMKGIGAGCDEEAERVIKAAPKWKPGKQRGRPVKQRIVIPIVFKLG